MQTPTTHGVLIDVVSARTPAVLAGAGKVLSTELLAEEVLDPLIEGLHADLVFHLLLRV